MKKLILLTMLMAASAFGQRSLSVSTNGMPLPVGSWGLQIAPTNMVWTGIHENRAVVTNTVAGSQRFDGGFLVSTIATNQNLRVPGTALFTGATTNVGAGRYESTLTIIGALTLTAATVFPDNIEQVFNPGAANAGLNVGSIAGDPSAPNNGAVWYDSTANELTARINGANVALGAGGGGTDATKIATNAGTGYFTSLLANTNYLRSTFRGSRAIGATNLTAAHSEFVLDGPQYARVSMAGNMTIGIVPPTSATDVGMVGIIRVLEANGSPRTITWSNVTARGLLPLNVGTNMFYINWDGTNYWVEAGQLATSGSGDFYVLTNAPTINNANLIGNPTAPTATTGDNDTSLATTAFVQGTLGASNFMTTRVGVWRGLPVMSWAYQASTTNGATQATNSTTAGGADYVTEPCWRFDDTITNTVHIGFIMPRTWDGGTVKLILSTASAATPGTNTWEVKGKVVESAGDRSGAWGTAVTVNQILPATAQFNAQTNTPSITLAGTPAGGKKVYFAISRLSGHAGELGVVGAADLLSTSLLYKEATTEPAAP